MLGEENPLEAGRMPDLGDTVAAAEGLGPSIEKKQDHAVHIRVQQRNGRQSITTVSGLPDLEYKKLLSVIKRTFACNGAIRTDAGFGTIIQLQGDQRDNLQKFLVDEHIVQADDIRVHGF